MTEWEYGTALRTPRGELWDEEREASRESAEGHVLSCSAGLHEGNHEPDKCVLIRRTRGVAAGPWEPVEENTPTRTDGPER